MEIEFKQKKGATSRKFVLTLEKIIVEIKTLRKNDKYEVKLDRLGHDIHYQSDNTLPGKIFLGICIIWVIGSLFGFFYTVGKDHDTWLLNAILGAIMTCIAYFKQHQDDIYLVGGEVNLVFFRDIPNEKAVLDFIESIKVQIKCYLREKYTIFDSTTSEQDFYARINWLHQNEVITHSEYVEYKINFDAQKLF